MTRRRSLSDRRLNLIALLSAVIGAAAVVIGVIVLTSQTPSGPHVRSCRNASNSASPFACDSVWNKPLPTRLRATANSGAYDAQLVAQVKEFGAWINTDTYSVPLYRVAPDQRRVPVVLDTSGPGTATLAQGFRAGVPIPADAVAAGGTDEHMVVWQPATDTLWEFWLAHKVNGVWHARWGGEMRHVSANAGFYPGSPYWGATATSLSVLGGLMGIAELRSGRIDHALALAIPKVAAGTFTFPAQRTDGNDHAPGAIPEGTRFRLDPHLDIAALHLPRLTAMIAAAAQQYGMIVRDQSGAVSLYAQQTPPGRPNPYLGPRGLFEGVSPSQLLKDFPWQDLQVVRPPGPSG